MNTEQTPRPWYKKRRYIAPLAFTGSFVVLAATIPPTEPEPVSLPNPEPVTVQAAPAPVTGQNTENTTSGAAGAAAAPVVAPAPKPAPSTAAAPSRSCHPSYSGCLNPNASDYDCAGGSGNGPYYTGAVRVIGPDVYDLDRDGDGYGCE